MRVLRQNARSVWKNPSFAPCLGMFATWVMLLLWEISSGASGSSCAADGLTNDIATRDTLAAPSAAATSPRRDLRLSKSNCTGNLLGWTGAAAPETSLRGAFLRRQAIRVPTGPRVRCAGGSGRIRRRRRIRPDRSVGQFDLHRRRLGRVRLAGGGDRHRRGVGGAVT